MLQAMNTGHDGSLTTLHANTPRDVQLRLEVMVRSAQDLPIDAIHRQIASALHLVVQLERGRDGRRRVTHITEIKGLDERLGGVRMVDLFRLIEHQGTDSDLQPTGHLPSFIVDLMTAGNLDLNAFYQEVEAVS
jgi:Flp pilus assembly CpaF family ATPase